MGDGSGADRSSAITAWDVSTSDIKVRKSYLHDNFWNGVLVGSEGAFMHNKWEVKDNTVSNHGFIGIELTNSDKSKIENNMVSANSFCGILVQARNTTGSGVSPVVSNVKVNKNDVSGTTSSAAIRLLAYEGTTGPPFSSIGASARITHGDVKHNSSHDNGNDGIRFQGFNLGTVDDIKVDHNSAATNTGWGVRLANADMSNINHNTATGNGADGFLADSSSTANTFEHNTEDTNGGYGYKDDTVGPSNSYKNNDCSGNTAGGSSPSGLCKPQP